MRKVLLALLLLLLLCASVSAADSQIDNLSQEISINTDGEVLMTVTAEVSFVSEVKTFLFPLGTAADDVNASGASCDVETRNGIEYAVFTDAAGFSGKRTFVCSYTLPSAVKKTEDGQQFSLALIERGWAYPIKALSLRMQFPVAVTAQPMWTSAYYGDVIDNYLNVQITEERILEVSSTKELKDHEQLTMTVDFPAETFELYHQRGSIGSIFSTVFYALILAAFVYWFFFLRGRLLLPKAQQTVGMEATAGELACQLYGTSPDIAAILAHWGNLGYLTIHHTRRGRVLLQKQMDMGNERKFAERRLFDAIFRSGDAVDATTDRFRQRTADAGASLRQNWLHRLFAARSGSPELLRRMMLLASLALNLLLFDLWVAEIGLRWVLIPILAVCSTYPCGLFYRGFREFLHGRYLKSALGPASAVVLLLFASAAGCTGLMSLNLLLQTFFALLTCFGGRRTAEGHDIARSLLGLRHHLRTADMDTLLKALEADSQYFYRTLPFAELLGVGAPFARHCTHLPSEPCPWLTDSHKTPKTAADFYRLYAEVASAIRTDPHSRLSKLFDAGAQKRPAPNRSRRQKNSAQSRRRR